MAAARRVRERLSRRHRVPQRRPQGAARCDPAGSVDVRCHRRAHLLPDAGAHAGCLVRSAAQDATLRHDWRASFYHAVTGFSEDAQFAPAREALVHHALMGDIIRPGGMPMRLAGEVIGTAPIERVDVLHGVQVVQTARPYGASDLGRRVRVLWQGAEYRGRGRETHWDGRLMLTGNRFSRFAPVNFLNPERRVLETTTGTALAWSSVTTGNLAGVDIWLDEASRGRLSIETNIVSGDIDLALLACEAVVLDGRGLGRQISIYRLPETDWSARVALDHTARFSGGTDLPVYLRVTQADGHQAWSSPIYLID